MRRFQHLFLVGVVFAANGFVAACSGDSNPATDGGSDAGKDVIVKDVTSKDAPADVAPPVVITPAGKQLLSSDQVQIFGITTDDKVIYSDIGGGFVLYAADANGTGTPTVIATPTVSQAATFILGISGKVVFLWEGIATTANAPQVGKLSTWTSAGGFKAGIQAKSCASTGFAATTDGSKIMYSANSNTTCTTGDIVGSNWDGTSPSTLQTAVDIAATNCAPQLGFAGGVGAVTSVCATDPGDGGTQLATVTSYTAAWVPTPIITSAESFWASDTAGDKLMVSSAAGIQVFPFAGGLATLIDATNKITSGTFGYMFKDGSTVIYSTTGGDLYYAAVSVTPAPTKMVTGDAKFFRSISSDDKYLMYSKAFDTKQFASDIYLRTTNTTAASTTLVSTTTGALFGLNFTDDFTTDAKYALYIANADTQSFIGDLMVVPVGGTTGVKIASAEWLNLSATGSKIVYNDNCQGCGTNQNNQVIGTADIKSVDVSTTTAPAMLQAGADPQIYIPPTSKSHVVYTFSQNAPGSNVDGGPLPNGNGLWTVAIP